MDICAETVGLILVYICVHDSEFMLILIIVQLKHGNNRTGWNRKRFSCNILPSYSSWKALPFERCNLISWLEFL